MNVLSTPPPRFLLHDVHESFRASYRAEMSTKHVRTTSDLVRFGCGLRIDCVSCGASRTVDGLTIAKVAGSVDLTELLPRLVCERCGQRDARLTKLPPPPRR